LSTAVPSAQGIVYGLVQGLTEFLPVSSSAHLVLVPWAFGWTDLGLGFDVALHVGTLAAVLGYFGRDWIAILRGVVASLGRGELAANPEARLFWKIGLASLPAAAAGLILEDAAATLFRAPLLVAAPLAGFALLLWWSDRTPGTRHDLDRLAWGDALWIGVAQALAIVPGVSRSGVTITAARFLAMDREAAARFSFLLSTPIIGGAALLKARALVEVARDPGQALAILAAAVSGAAAIAILLRWVRTRSYTPFVVYRLVLALAIIAVLGGRG
jgi:undecaprenyl-diphosphatase